MDKGEQNFYGWKTNIRLLERNIMHLSGLNMVDETNVFIRTETASNGSNAR